MKGADAAGGGRLLAAAGPVGGLVMFALRWHLQGFADGPVKATGTRGAVSGATLVHAAAAADGPALTGLLHAGLEDVFVSALNNAGANGKTSLAELGVAHALGVGAVVADELVEGGEVVVGGAGVHAIEEL